MNSQIRSSRVLVMDVDGTIARSTKETGDYRHAEVISSVKQRLIELKQEGFWIVLYTSRNMRTFAGNLGLISRHTLPDLIMWLEENEIPFDEVHVGKPWCGNDGFYVDDRAIRPKEFATLSLSEIRKLIERDSQI
jgi:capsule biosynthesis phosphatase